MPKGDPKSDVCPCCGYCRHCGRGGHQAVPFYPVRPWYQPTVWPTWISTTPTVTVTSGSTTTSNVIVYPNGD